MSAHRVLPVLGAPDASGRAQIAGILTDLQSSGARWTGDLGLHRVGGAGPSDHKALRIFGETIMVPVLTKAASVSSFEIRVEDSSAGLYSGSSRLADVGFPPTPNFYAHSTAEGVPYWKIATLHSHDVLATTVLQHCVRYGDRETSCQFCAIGQSLKARKTIPHKTPEQLAEVAEAAVRLDGVSHAVLTTGTPPGDDRGAAVLCESSQAIREATGLPIQAQCEPPADFAWFDRLRDAGVRTLGLHLEVLDEALRARIMPGKAEVPLETYFAAFEAAVSVFGRAQVTTYILAGLGDSEAAIEAACERLVDLGVYPFVVPFVPIAGTPLESHPPPSAAFMNRVLDRVARVLATAGMDASQIHAGCGRCGACSTLKVREGRVH